MNEQTSSPSTRLRATREQAKLTRDALAMRVGFAATTVRAHENGQNGIRPDAALAYAAALNIKPEWLLYGDGDPTGAYPVAPPGLPTLSQGATLLAVRGLVAGAEHATETEASELKELAAWLSKRAFA